MLLNYIPDVTSKNFSKAQDSTKITPESSLAYFPELFWLDVKSPSQNDTMNILSFYRLIVHLFNLIHDFLDLLSHSIIRSLIHEFLQIINNLSSIH